MWEGLQKGVGVSRWLPRRLTPPLAPHSAPAQSSRDEHTAASLVLVSRGAASPYRALVARRLNDGLSISATRLRCLRKSGLSVYPAADRWLRG